jgi:hypothetical protein
MARYTGTIAVSPTTIQFGDKGYLAYHCSHPKPWARITCYTPENGSVGMVSYINLWAGATEFVAGPTPSWGGGPADGSAELVYWNGRRFVTVATATFSVI